jgi:hypothetical protein
VTVAPPEFYSDLRVVDTHRDVRRNIVSLRRSRNLFDDLSDDPAEQALAQQVESAVKPPHFRSPTPVIDRPFEEAAWFDAIGWPFRHWQSSRYSDGSFGVWYGADTVETTVRETAYHWYHGLIGDAEGYAQQPVAIERKVYDVACEALLLDLRSRVETFPALLHRSDYSFTQQVGARLQREGHPGLLAPSVRHRAGLNYVLFNAGVLSDPRVNCMLTYRLQGEHIVVERRTGETWRRLRVADL